MLLCVWCSAKVCVCVCAHEVCMCVHVRAFVCMCVHVCACMSVPKCIPLHSFEWVLPTSDRLTNRLTDDLPNDANTTPSNSLLSRCLTHVSRTTNAG